MAAVRISRAPASKRGGLPILGWAVLIVTSVIAEASASVSSLITKRRFIVAPAHGYFALSRPRTL